MFRQATNRSKRAFEAAKHAYGNKTKYKIEFITYEKLSSWDFWKIPNSVLSKAESDKPPLFNNTEVLPSASHEAKLFPNSFSKNSNVDDLDVSLPAFPSITNMKVHNISVTPKMVKKIIGNLNL